MKTLLDLYVRGIRGESFRATLFTYIVSIALLAPVGVLVAHRWDDNVAGVAVIIGTAVVLLVAVFIRKNYKP